MNYLIMAKYGDRIAYLDELANKIESQQFAVNNRKRIGYKPDE